MESGRKTQRAAHSAQEGRVLRGNKVKRQVDWKFIIPFLLTLAVFLFAAVKLGMLLWENYKGGREYQQIEESVVSIAGQADSTDGRQEGFSVDFDKLRKINPHVVGWIRIEKLGVSYPIVQGEDNDYYLSHTFYKEENKCGSIFIEVENSKDFSDFHTFVYGHNMKDKSMFARLNEFQEEETLRENPQFFIYTPEGVRRYEIYSCHIAKLGTESFLYRFGAEKDYAQWQTDVKEQSLYDTGVEPKSAQSTVTLMTCTPAGSQYRFLVHGVLAE